MTHGYCSFVLALLAVIGVQTFEDVG